MGGARGGQDCARLNKKGFCKVSKKLCRSRHGHKIQKKYATHENMKFKSYDTDTITRKLAEKDEEVGKIYAELKDREHEHSIKTKQENSVDGRIALKRMVIDNGIIVRKIPTIPERSRSTAILVLTYCLICEGSFIHDISTATGVKSETLKKYIRIFRERGLLEIEKAPCRNEIVTPCNKLLMRYRSLVVC